MAKKTVAQIKQEAIETRDFYKGKHGDCEPTYPMNIRELRWYCDKVLFLCRHIETLEKKLKGRR